jgi:phage shock protein E
VTAPRPRLRLLAAVALGGVLLLGCAQNGDGAAIETAAGEEAVAAVSATDAVVIDVRTPEEVAQGSIAGAMHIDFLADGFAERVDALDRDVRYVLYCRTGNRSGQAAEVMADMGFTDLVNAGGFDDLVAAGAPTAP